MARTRKNINIQLIAERTGVSIATVSRVINQRSDVSEKTRQLVMNHLRELNFDLTKPTDRLVNIGVLIPEKQLSRYSTQIIDGMIEAADSRHVNLSVLVYVHWEQNSAQPRPDSLQLLREHRCDAAAVIGAERLGREFGALEESGLPLMLINCPRRGRRIGYIDHQSYSGARKAAEYLISLGHRSIGFLESEIAVAVNHRERRDGYLDAMHDAGLSVDERWLVPQRSGLCSHDLGYVQMTQLINRSPELTAVLVCNDDMAMGALLAAWESGLSVPGDLSVIGFDDNPSTAYLHPPLTTVRQPLHELGKQAVNALDDYLKGVLEQLPETTLATELVVRASTAPPGRKDAPKHTESVLSRIQ